MRVVVPAETTSRVASTRADKAAASVTGSSGGQSITTMSALARKRSRTSAARGEASHSGGFGGRGPEASTRSDPTPGTRWSARPRGTSPSSTEVSPTPLSSPKKSWSLGRLRSQSNAATAAPASAMATARFATVVVLPSVVLGLVTWRTRTGLLSPSSCTEVRRLR